MEKNNLKAWLYLLPAILFIGVFLVYPLIDVLIYSFEEDYNFASQTYFGVGFYNYGKVLRDPFFLQAIKNTLILVFITVPLSTAISLAISVALASVKKLRDLFQTVYFLPYVTNTLAVGLVFMILFKPTAYSDGLVNLFLSVFGISPIDFIDGPYWAKMLTLCVYTIWVVMPFKILILTTAIASVKQDYYNAAMIDGMIDRFCAEFGKDLPIFATGGYSHAIIPHCKHEITLDPDMVLDGLYVIYNRNK
jgi:multiple sugar transport system permease protein